MADKDSFLDRFKQNDHLPIRLVSPDFGHLSAEEAQQFGTVRRTPYYFFLLMLEGCTQHRVDMEQLEVSNNELLFLLPHQVHEVPQARHGSDYFKLGVDEICLALLPQHYPFLVNPLNSQKISL